MTATQRKVLDESAEDTISLTEEYEVCEPSCVLRIPDSNGGEQAITLRPGESVAAVMARNNIHRAQPDVMEPMHVD